MERIQQKKKREIEFRIIVVVYNKKIYVSLSNGFIRLPL